MAKKITKRTVDAAKPGETIWDSALPGFGLRVFASGARSYVLKYRRGGVQRWFTIGRHGKWTPDQARSEAMRLLGRIENGEDPASKRVSERNAATVAEFADRYLKEFSNTHKKASTARHDAANLKNYILPALGKMRIRDVTQADVARFHLSLKKTPYLANRCRALLSHMFGKAEAWSERPEGTNPTRHVEKFKEKARNRFLSTEELKRLGGALSDGEREGESPYTIGAIRLLLFTGARLSEILTLRWEHVDFQARLLRLPDSKTGEKTVALPAPALQVLESLPRQDGNPFVICGRRTGARLVNLQKPWSRIRERAGISDVRLHDLRHSFASIGASGGMGLPLIGSLLGHKQAQTTMRYAHLANDPRLNAADTIAAEISATMAGEIPKVIPLKKSG